jgi:2,3-bisphosphoglycerate-independent phosphoglycerate mutase
VIEQGIKISFVYTGKRQGLLFLSGQVSAELTDSDPFSDGLPVVKVQPLAEARDKSKAEQTAQILNHYLVDVFDHLDQHPVNQKRRKDGLPPLNFLTTKWAGQERELDPFWDRYGFKGVSIASSPLFKGLAGAVGLDYIDQPELDDPGDDLASRLRKAAERLQKDHDFVHVHTKAPDEAAHTKRPRLKKEVIEKLDKAFNLLIDEKTLFDDCLVVITADHATPSQGTLIHSGEAVPVLFVGRAAGADDVKKFSESASRKGALGQLYGRDLMPLIINFTDRIKYFGSRNFGPDHPARPSKDRIIPLRREP